MICKHEVIYSVCSRNFCGILSASEDFMTHDEMMSLLANTLADAAGHAPAVYLFWTVSARIRERK